MIKNVFFDFNGTLIDDIDLTLDIENKLLVQRGLNAVTKEFYLDNFCFPVINYYKKSGFDLTKINFSELNAEFMNEYTERFLKDSKLFDDVEITLKKAEPQGSAFSILQINIFYFINLTVFDINTGDSFVYKTAEFIIKSVCRVRNVLNGNRFVTVCSHKRHFVTDKCVGNFGYINHKLIHTHSAHNRTAYAFNNNLTFIR